MSRIMFSSIKSGSGKTTVVCAILQALKNRKLNIKGYKCGPDYIDSMYHRAIGIKSSNLDSFFCNRDEICALLDYNGFSIIEGAMGFYDGLSFTDKASAYEISEMTNTPVVLILDCKGMANSVEALIYGFKNYKKNNIIGVIFNKVSPMVYNKLSEMASKMGIIPLGYFPYNTDFNFESRHLGLKEPDKNKLEILACQAEKTIDLDKIIEISNNEPLKYKKINIEKRYNKKIAVAFDEAFSFLYEDNINLLKSYGCEIIYFSPLRDKFLPKCDRLIISGGYPELFAKELSENKSLILDIKNKIENGLKTIAECGGFMYLHREICDYKGKKYKMVGIIDGICEKGDKLQNFGYFNMKAKKDNLISKAEDIIKVHEFHYWKSTANGEDFYLQKPNSNKAHFSAYGCNNLYCGFPHIYFWGNRDVVEKFLGD
ncbi:MAG: cobyrinate a,c-diamide synthase [Lachnospirales bacterium]